jgi:hypothetical protein
LAWQTEAECPVGVGVCLIGGDQTIGVLLINRLAFTLKIRAIGATDQWAFVPIQSEPAESIIDGIDGVVILPGSIGVLDAEDKFSVVMAGKKPVEKGGASSTDMEVTGGRGSEANANFWIHKGGGT